MRGGAEVARLWFHIDSSVTGQIETVLSSATEPATRAHCKAPSGTRQPPGDGTPAITLNSDAKQLPRPVSGQAVAGATV